MLSKSTLQVQRSTNIDERTALKWSVGCSLCRVCGNYADLTFSSAVVDAVGAEVGACKSGWLRRKTCENYCNGFRGERWRDGNYLSEPKRRELQIDPQLWDTFSCLSANCLCNSYCHFRLPMDCSLRNCHWHRCQPSTFVPAIGLHVSVASLYLVDQPALLSWTIRSFSQGPADPSLSA